MIKDISQEIRKMNNDLEKLELQNSILRDKLLKLEADVMNLQTPRESGNWSYKILEIAIITTLVTLILY